MSVRLNFRFVYLSWEKDFFSDDAAADVAVAVAAVVVD